MPKSSIKYVVEAALNRLASEPTEEVTHELFEIIEKDMALPHEYDTLCEDYGPYRLSGHANVNPTIASWVKKRTGRSMLSATVYGIRPVLAETFVAPDYRGSCFQAAGWRRVGHTSGRRLRDSVAGPANRTLALCWAEKPDLLSMS